MENFHLQTGNQVAVNRTQQYFLPSDAEIQGLAPTLFLKVSAKNEITINSKQLKEASWLFKQYGLKKAGWLRRRFYINQRRRKLLNQQLREAGLDCSWCPHHHYSQEWDSQLHQLWHSINNRSSCI